MFLTHSLRVTQPFSVWLNGADNPNPCMAYLTQRGTQVSKKALDVMSMV